MNATIQIPALQLLVIAVLLVLFGLVAAVLSYLRLRADNERQRTLNALADTLKAGWSDLNGYHQEVRELHDATMTKLGVLGDKEERMRQRGEYLKALDQSLQAMDSIVGVFRFPSKLLLTVAHEKDVTGMVVTGVVMRHPDNHMNCTMVEFNETWIAEHPRMLPPVEAEAA